MILGIDLGNVNVKTSTGVLYPNKLTQDERVFENTDRLKVEYDGKKIVIGEGEYQTNYVKSQKKDILLSLFAAVGSSTQDNINQVVLGLPIQQFKTDKETLESLIIENKISDITIDKIERRIIISDCRVFPEGLATYYSLKEVVKQQIGKRDIIIIDVGGRTTDICLYAIEGSKRKLQNYVTIPAGTLNIYSDFITAINGKYGLDKLKEDAAGILNQGLWVDGEKVSLKYTRTIFEKYFDRIMGEVRLNYPIRTAQVILCGGGGILLKGMFQKEIKSLIVIEDIFSNANGFKEVGDSIWR
jgi:plasmid segregation protein ParM